MDPRVMKVLALVWPEGISLSDYDLMLPMVQLVSTALRRSDRTKKDLESLETQVKKAIQDKGRLSKDPELMTSNEVALFFGVKRETVAHMAARQGLKVAQRGRGGRAALYRRADVIAFKEAREKK